MKVFTNKNLSIEQYGFINTFPNQNYILSYLHPYNPYSSLIVCYDVGLGKTYAAACLAHMYLDSGFKVLYLSNSLNSIDNFSNEYEKVVLDSRLNSLKKNITIKSFSKFYNCEKRGESDNVDYGLIILDEVHNLRESAYRYKLIKNKLDTMNNSKILVITATPMIDSKDELDSILSLTKETSRIIFSENKIDIKISYVGQEINGETLFLSEMKGQQLKEYLKVVNEENDTVYSSSRQASISLSNKFNPSIPLDEQSSKINAFINSIKEGELTILFSFYVKRGIDFTSSVLESIGYKKWNSNKKQKRTYAVIDGRTNKKNVEEILTSFNSIANIKGDNIHILLGSSVLSESITLYRVKHLHIISPFWNYGQIKQSIGRAIRIGSHEGLEDKSMKVYLHAAHYDKEGKDIDIWKIAYDKNKDIIKRLEELKIDNEFSNDSLLDIPKIDNEMVIKINEWVWDFRNCFDTNKFKISWCKIYEDKAIGYNLENNTKIMGNIPSYIRINRPIPGGYTIWRSCIDKKLRISFIDGEVNKFSKRGKLISNVNTSEIAKDLNCENNIESIINTLKEQNRYFDKQIEYDL